MILGNLLWQVIESQKPLFVTPLDIVEYGLLRRPSEGHHAGFLFELWLLVVELYLLKQPVSVFLIQ